MIFDFDAVILPGSKNTIEDLAALEKNGMADAIRAFHKCGGTVVGLCGGYQMMGRVVRDPRGMESALPEIAGLGILDMETEIYPEKVTSQVEAEVAKGSGLFSGCEGVLHGYEIHMGLSSSPGGAAPLFTILRRDGKPEQIADGLAQPDGRAWGTYIHGIFDNDALRNSFLLDVAERSGRGIAPVSGAISYRRWKEEQYDLLAEFVRTHVDVGRVLEDLFKH